MNGNNVNCLIFVALVLGIVFMARRDRGSYKRIELVEVKELDRYEENDIRLDGSPAPGCREVVIIQANSILDLKRWTDGTTIQGNRTRVHTRLGNNLYMLSSEAWANRPPEKPDGMSPAAYIQALKNNGWEVRE